ncbi:MAG: hypothetical protein ABIH23_19195 [bacterium]
MSEFLLNGYCLARDPSQPNVFYAGGSRSGDSGYEMWIMKTEDGGRRWRTYYKLPSIQAQATSECRDIAVAASNSMVIYAVGVEAPDWYDQHGKVFRSADGGESWEDVTSNLSSFHTSENVSSYNYWYLYTVLVHPTDPNRVFVGSDRGVFATTDGGASWNSTGLSESVQTFAYDQSTETLYAGTAYNGVYYSRDGGQSWEAFNNGLDCLEPRCMDIDPANGYLYIGTQGGGVWRIPLLTGIEEWRVY